jgi:peroxiredoxin
MKKIIKWSLLLFIFCSIALMASVSFQKLQNQTIEKKTPLIIPQLRLTSVDTVDVNFATWSENVLLIYFNSDCSHCQYEAEEIKKNVDRLRKVKVVFMSSEPLSKIKLFAEAYKLDAQENIHFTNVNPEHVAVTFGALAIPHIFIYGPDKTLRKEFRGETKIEAILKYLE